MSLLIVSVVLLNVFVIIFLYVKYIYSYWKRRGVPYIKPSIPFGNFGPLFMGTRSIGQNVHDLYNATTKPLVGVFLALRPVLLIRNPKIVKDILIKDFHHFRDRGFHFDAKVDPLVANLFSSDENWKENRAKLSPAFTSGKLKGMFNAIVNCSKPLEECVKEYAITGKEVEVRELFSRFTTNVIASVGFGLEIDSFKDPNNEFREKGSRIFEPLTRNLFRFSMSFLSPYLTKLLKIRFSDRDVEDFMIEIVRNNLEYRERNSVVRKDFFQLLMQIRNAGQVKDDGEDWDTKPTNDIKSLSLDEIAANTFIFIVAGYESSATTMTFFMYEMAKNPNIQQKVQNEINDVLERYDGKINYESLSQMKYLDCCIDETLRKHPPFDMLIRECTKDYKISDTDIAVEKGTLIFFSITGPQYDAKYYENPDTFMPERFMTDQNVNKNSSDKPYLTFGDGPRNCMGMRLGKLQAKIGICTLLRKFSFELGANLRNSTEKLEPQATTRMFVGGTKLKIKVR